MALVAQLLEPYSSPWWSAMVIAGALFCAALIDLAYRGISSLRKRYNVNLEHQTSNHTVARDTPIWRAVAHIRVAINDTDHDKLYPTTLNVIRQAALDGKIKLRGRREIDTGGRQQFSNVRSDISPEYWKVSTIGAMATDERYQGGSWPHTNPETAYAWGPKGVYEKNRYADLTVNMQEIRRLWPYDPS